MCIACVDYLNGSITWKEWERNVKELHGPEDVLDVEVVNKYITDYKNQYGRDSSAN